MQAHLIALVEERKNTVEKYKKDFDNIKVVCAQFFEKYDDALKKVQIQSEQVMQKYQDWSRVLIEPTSINEARLFALESRLKKEEEFRIKDSIICLDSIKKLVLTLEQQCQSHERPHKKKKGDQSTMLPMLGGKGVSVAQSLDLNSQKSHLSGGDFLYEKRLQFLRMLLEKQDFKEEQKEIDKEAEKAQESRMQEIWKIEKKTTNPDHS